MSSAAPLEALLRPPIELWSALTAGCAALVTFFSPQTLMLSEAWSYPVALGLTLLCLLRFQQAARVIRYQRNMKRLPVYQLAPDKIPVSHTHLFLGRGFRWYQEHSQRLYDAKKPWVRRYIEPGYGYHLARRLELRYRQTRLIGHLVCALSQEAWWNPVPPIAPLGGKIALHAVGLVETEVVKTKFFTSSQSTPSLVRKGPS